MQLSRRTLLIGLLAIVSLSGCQTGNPNDAFKRQVSAVEQRSLDSRRFETGDERTVLNAVVGLLQDLGFKVDETSAEAGMVSASKGAGQVAGHYYATDIRATVTTRPIEGEGTVVRATFQNITQGRNIKFSRATPVRDPKLYQDFFDKLAQSLFLEAHQI